MDARRFDSLARGLATPKSRRGFLASLGAITVAAVGGRHGLAQVICPPGQTPNNKGECRCPPGTDACPDGCFDVRRDLANCGECGQGCFGGECRKGECRCPGGFILCGDTCVDPASDEANCGGCEVGCAPGDVTQCEGVGVCDSGVCGFAPAPAGTVCRDAAGACDVAEFCDGVSQACPADQLVASGTLCRGASGACDVDEFCTGSSPFCPDDGGVPNGQQGGCEDGFVCLNGDCGVACGSAADCPASSCGEAFCADGVCGLNPVADGVSCGTGLDCIDGACVGNGVCAVGFGCGIPEDPTPPPVGCPIESECRCSLTTEGAAVCLSFAETCAEVSECTTSADCPAGRVCETEGTASCCGINARNVCNPLCAV